MNFGIQSSLTGVFATGAATPAALDTTQEAKMPLFFIIAIGAGAFTLGATTVDVTSDMRQHDRTAQVQTTTFQASAYATQEECLNAAARQGVSASACQRL
jgi:hypothetical protein